MNVQTGNVAYRLPHESPVISAIFNQDNHFIASGDIDGIIRVWETNTEGKQIARLQHFVPNGPLGSISHSSTSRLDLLSTSSDGKFIATGSRLNYSVKLWDTETGEQVAEIVHQNAISSIAFSPNGQWFATSEWCFQFCQEPISVHIWGLNGDRIAQIDLGEDYQKTTVSFSPDSSILIVETDQETIELWQTTTWEQINILSNVSHFIVSSNGHLITATNINSIFHIFNLSQEQEIGKIPEPLYLTFSFDGNRLAWVSRSGFIQVDELLDKSKQSFQIPYQGEIKGLTFNSNGQWLAVLGDDDSIVIWDVITQEQVAVKNDYASINSIDFSINNKLFIMVPQEQNIYIWDPLSDRDDLIIMSNSAKFEQFENYIFTSLLNETRIWDENTGREISRMIHDELVLDFIVNREYLITSTDGGSAYVWTWSQMNLISEACLHLTRNLTQKEWSTYFPNESYRQTCPNLNN